MINYWIASKNRVLNVIVMVFLGAVSLERAEAMNSSWLKTFQPFIEASSFSYADQMPIYAFDNDLKGDFPSDGRYTFSRNQLESGFRYRGVEFSQFSRFDYYFRTNADTFALFYWDKNKVDFPVDSLFDVYLHVQKVELAGYKLGYHWQLHPSMKVFFAARYFESDDVLFGQISGRLWQTSKRPYGDLNLDYIYTEDTIFDRPLTPPAKGSGYGFDLGWIWQLTPEFEAELWLEDVGSRINWRHAPHTRAEMVSNRNRVGPDGKPYKVPTLQAFESFIDRTQPLPQHSRMQLRYRAWSGLGMDFWCKLEQARYDRKHFDRVYLDWVPSRWFTFEAGYDFTSRAQSLGLLFPGVSIRAATDTTNLKQSRNLRLEIGLSYRFD